MWSAVCSAQCMHFCTDMASTLCCPTFCLRSAHLHRVPQPFVLREIENHVTGGRKTVHSSVHSTSHDKISYRTQQFLHAPQRVLPRCG